MFWRFENNAYLCNRFRTGPKSNGLTLYDCKGIFASLAQLARARDL